MEKITDWVALWNQLVMIGEERRLRKSQQKDSWVGKAREFDDRVTARWQCQDSSRDFVIKTLQEFPDSTVLDIGAGSGAWALLMSPYARFITALDPSESMLECLREQVQKSDAKNIRVVPGSWPEMNVDLHDISFCSHAMYGAADFPGFISAMQAVTRKRCILLVRAPHPEGIMARAAQTVYGHRFDSPNFQIAYNILLDMGIYANVLMEDTGWWKPWRSSSLETALDDLKSRLGIFENDQYDQELKNLLEENLRPDGGEFVWPRGVRTALVYWDIEPI